MRFSAFSLVELLIVLGSLAVLMALLFPTLACVREAPRQVTCLSNIRQLGSACRLYLSDWDETQPLLWWAGATYPYVRQVQVYHCPDDGNTQRNDKGQTAYPLSYTRNYDLMHQLNDSQLTAPSQTVLLFEVTGVNAQLRDATEGARSDTVGPQQFSGGETGLDCDLVTTSFSTQEPYPNAQYATGWIDNAVPAEACSPSQFESHQGRHRGGANFMAADVHVKWSMGTRVSAGYSALTASAAQSRTGCANYGTPPTPDQPCAAGTQNDRHALTFSLN